MKSGDGATKSTNKCVKCSFGPFIIYTTDNISDCCRGTEICYALKLDDFESSMKAISKIQQNTSIAHFPPKAPSAV